MDNLLMTLIGMGNQGGAAGSSSSKGSAGTTSNQKGFLSILTNILSGSDSQQSILKKLNEIQESGEPGLAYVMSSISNILLSMIPPEAGKAVPEVTGQEIFENTENKQDLKVLENTTTQEIKDLSSLLEQMNYSVLQGIFKDTKSETADNASTNQIVKGLEKENGTVTEVEIEQVKALQGEMIKLLSYINGKSDELSIDKGKISFQDEFGEIPVQNAAVVNVQQALLKEQHDTESEMVQTRNTQVTNELSTKEILEKNAIFLRASLENEGKANLDDSSKSNKLGDNKGIDGLFETDEKLAHNAVKQNSSTEQGLGEKNRDKTEDEAHALILNAAKKYKEHVSEANEIKTISDNEIVKVSPQNTNDKIPQGDSFRSNVLQIKDNNMTFEKGSFTSFVTDRIEKIVEQFSNRGSQMDMVVRLKLDDKETLLVGLKQEGQRVIVDVKASNDGLVNLIQAHKDDIARHLEDKNIFTSIFVQPDGEKNSERQNERENKKEGRKQEAGTSFINILEATA